MTLDDSWRYVTSFFKKEMKLRYELLDKKSEQPWYLS